MTAAPEELTQVAAVGRMSSYSDLMRRVLSFAVALPLLILVSPIVFVLIIAIRIDSPGPAFFVQERIGLMGRRFKLIKLRGMYVDAQERWPELYDYNYSEKEAASLLFHIHGDPRVTRVGRIIRRTSLDELPNLLNVLRGDINMVGPRPEIPEIIQYYGNQKSLILSVRPGLTSIAKVCGRDDLTLEETLRLESEYVTSRSLTLDMKILFKTAWIVLRQADMADE